MYKRELIQDMLMLYVRGNKNIFSVEHDSLVSFKLKRNTERYLIISVRNGLRTLRFDELFS